MRSKDMLKTVLKIFGIFFLVQTILNLRDLVFHLIFIFFDEQTQSNVLLTAQTYLLVFHLGLGFLLIFKADWLAQKVSPNESREVTIGLDRTDWLELAFVSISLLAILHAVPEVLSKVVNFMYFNDYPRNERHLFWTIERRAAVFYSIFEFIAGLFLLSNARNFAGRLQKIGEKRELPRH